MGDVQNVRRASEKLAVFAKCAVVASVFGGGIEPRQFLVRQRPPTFRQINLEMIGGIAEQFRLRQSRVTGKRDNQPNQALAMVTHAQPPKRCERRGEVPGAGHMIYFATDAASYPIFSNKSSFGHSVTFSSTVCKRSLSSSAS